MIDVPRTFMLAGLVPETYFTRSPEWVLWVITGLAIPVLAVGAGRLVDSAVRLARTIGMTTVLIGATIVSLGTTSPEAVVSVRAAIGGDGDLALGNAVGSIICDTALIFGLCCVLVRLPKDRFVLSRHGWLQLGAGALLVAIALAGWLVAGDINNVWIGRPVGLALLVLLVGYMALSVRWARQHPEIIPREAVAVAAPPQPRLGRIFLYLIGLVFGLALVVFGSELLVGSVSEISHRHHVPKAVIAVTLVAFGTSLPELVTALASLIKGHPGLLVGNIIGADILNVLFVVGASATAVPLKVEPVFFKLLLPVMLLVLIMLRLFIYLSGDRFRRWQGVSLLVVYVAFVLVSVFAFGLADR